MPIQLPNWTLESGLRHNVFLATKEALNNIVKHAKATEAHLRLEVIAEGFELTIEDNGCAFSPPPAAAPDGERPARHGLESVRLRIEILGGTLSIDRAGARGGSRCRSPLPLHESPDTAARRQGESRHPSPKPAVPFCHSIRRRNLRKAV